MSWSGEFRGSNSSSISLWPVCSGESEWSVCCVVCVIAAAAAPGKAKRTARGERHKVNDGLMSERLSASGGFGGGDGVMH